MPPRRFTSIVFVIGIFVTAAIILSSSTREAAVNVVEAVTPANIQGHLGALEVPKFRFTFHKSVHKPPEQKNSSHGDSSWYSDWRWLNPFSSSVTLDENRAVLPPLPSRVPVYTYYDTIAKRGDDVLKADKELLKTWQRAWWARGFHPVILTQAEALNHPLYQTLKTKGMSQTMEAEFLRWLAWGHMGTGILSSWHCIPMTGNDDPMMIALRHGEFPHLARFEGLQTALFAGNKNQVNDAIKDALNDMKLNSYQSMTQAIPEDRWLIYITNAFAVYNSGTIASKYPILATELTDSPAKGRHSLNALMNAHLHTIWRNNFDQGVVVLKPMPGHTTSLIKPALDLARLLGECPESPVQASCPPNKEKCNPCVASKMQVRHWPSYRNLSTTYTIGMVPHPYTLLTLNNQTSNITIAHIRRETDRDPWLFSVTRDILGDGRGGPSRIVGLKDIVASTYGHDRTLWFVTEELPPSFDPKPEIIKAPTNDARPQPEKYAPLPVEWLEQLDWHFGFLIPRSSISHGESLPPVPGPERWPQSPAGTPHQRTKAYDPAPPSPEDIQVEFDLLRQARINVKSPKDDVARLKSAAEAWNLADTEAWKFVQAFRARALVEKMQFEEEESRYTGSNSHGSGRWWG